VAEFVGSPKINTLPGTVDAEGRASCLGTALSRRVAGGPASVTIAFRPEHLALVQDGGMLSGRVVSRENLGSDVFLHVALADGAHRVVVRARPDAADDAPIGAEVAIDRLRGGALVFAADGTRMQFADEAAPAAAGRAVA